MSSRNCGRAIVFEPEPTVRSDDEIELNANDCDVVFHDGREIPLGDSLADTLGLALDPYPRSPGAESALKGAKFDPLPVAQIGDRQPVPEIAHGSDPASSARSSIASSPAQ